jgi:hypothetical protein
MEMLQLRREAADQAFAEYDLGDWEVKDTGTWQADGDEFSMSFFLETGETDSIREVFVVRFEPNTSTVVDAYVAG